MDLNSGTKPGAYEIRSLIGADRRENAWKAGARLERDACTVSVLSYPNICVLHHIVLPPDVDLMIPEQREGETRTAGCHPWSPATAAVIGSGS